MAFRQRSFFCHRYSGFSSSIQVYGAAALRLAPLSAGITLLPLSTISASSVVKRRSCWTTPLWRRDSSTQEREPWTKERPLVEKRESTGMSKSGVSKPRDHAWLWRQGRLWLREGLLHGRKPRTWANGSVCTNCNSVKSGWFFQSWHDCFCAVACAFTHRDIHSCNPALRKKK